MIKVISMELVTSVVNADDFGLNSTVNHAIIESFRKGLINSTTLMANMPGFDEAIELAHNDKIYNNIGIHLNITEGIPLTDEIKSLPYLFNKKENSSTKRLRKLFFINKYNQKLIYKEYSAQIKKLKSHGLIITHLDTHHQVHDMWSIMNIMIALMKDHSIPSMRILNNLEHSTLFYKNVYRNVINNFLKIKKVNFTDFLGNQNDFKRMLAKYPMLMKNKKVEIMVHPKFNSAGKLVDIIGGNEFDLQRYL
jgi:chitin disaccharide deacetylase